MSDAVFLFFKLNHQVLSSVSRDASMITRQRCGRQGAGNALNRKQVIPFKTRRFFRRGKRIVSAVFIVTFVDDDDYY
jgi:hypothetical protein